MIGSLIFFKFILYFIIFLLYLNFIYFDGILFNNSLSSQNQLVMNLVIFVAYKDREIFFLSSQCRYDIQLFFQQDTRGRVISWSSLTSQLAVLTHALTPRSCLNGPKRRVHDFILTYKRYKVYLMGSFK